MRFITVGNMHPAGALLIYLTAVFVGGPLLAPWVYWLAHEFLEGWTYLAEQPFRRYVNRCMLVIALLGMYPLIRAFGAKSLTELGLVNPVGHARRLLGGFMLGFKSMAVVVVICLISGVRGWDAHLSAGRLADIASEAALTAIGVSILEEVLFRGAIFGAFRKVMPWGVAALISSAIYGMLHFMRRVDDLTPEHWYSGLIVLGHMLSGFGDWHAVIPGFINLTLAGMLLALAYHRSGNLWLSIGLHGGWAFWGRAYGALTDDRWMDEGPAPAGQWFYGTEAMTDGWLAVLVLVAGLLLLTWWRFPDRPPPAETRQPSIDREQSV